MRTIKDCSNGFFSTYYFLKNRCYSEDTSVKAVVALLVLAFTIHVQINVSLASQFCQADYDKGNAAHNRYWYQCNTVTLKLCLASVMKVLVN